MSIENVLYRAYAEATGGREGRAISSDGVLDVSLTTPRELGGAGGEGTNPEQLFAAGYAACFENAVIHVSRNMADKVKDSDIEVGCEVSLLPTSRQCRRRASSSVPAGATMAQRGWARSQAGLSSAMRSALRRAIRHHLATETAGVRITDQQQPPGEEAPARGQGMRQPCHHDAAHGAQDQRQQQRVGGKSKIPGAEELH
eukprot:gene48519-59419_t